jgi:hypothetical protein
MDRRRRENKLPLRYRDLCVRGSLNQSMSIVVETIEAQKRRNFLVDSRAKIFDGFAIGV